MSLRSRVAGSSGQASIEWIAVVAVVALVLGAVGAAYADAGQIGRRITRELARGLCIVTSGDCYRDREPCVVTSDSHGSGAGISIVSVRLEGGTTVSVERRSDGTYAVTNELTGGAGGTSGIGVEASKDFGRWRASASAALRASDLALYGHGRTWIVHSEAEVAKLVGELKLHRQVLGGILRHLPGVQDPPRLPRPDVTYHEANLQASLDAVLGISSPLGAKDGDGVSVDAEASVGGEVNATFGTRVDRHTGHRTIYVAASAAVTAQAQAGGGLLGVSEEASTGGERYAVELDEKGDPINLSVLSSGRFAGSRDLPDAVQPVAGRLAVGGAGERGYEVQANLDLTDTANREAARGFLRELMHGHPRGAVDSASALRRLIDDRGTVEARVLEEHSDSEGAGASVAAEIKFGLNGHKESHTTRLLAAQSRGLDGQWLARDDCVARA